MSETHESIPSIMCHFHRGQRLSFYVFTWPYVNENETADGQTDGTPVLTSRPVKCKKKKNHIVKHTAAHCIH